MNRWHRERGTASGGAASAHRQEIGVFRPAPQRSPKGKICVRFSLNSPEAAFPAHAAVVWRRPDAIIVILIMNPNVFKWTDIAAARGIRIVAILLIALILNRLLRSVTRRMIPASGTEGLGRIARMREQHVKTLAGLLYSAGTAVIVVGA